MTRNFYASIPIRYAAEVHPVFPILDDKSIIQIKAGSESEARGQLRELFGEHFPHGWSFMYTEAEFADMAQGQYYNAVYTIDDLKLSRSMEVANMDSQNLGPWTVEVRYTYHVENVNVDGARRAVLFDIAGEPRPHDETMARVTRLDCKTNIVSALSDPFDVDAYFETKREGELDG